MNEAKEALRSVEQKYKLFQQQQFTFVAALEHCRENAHDKIRPIASIEQVALRRAGGRAWTGHLPGPDIPGQHRAALAGALKSQELREGRAVVLAAGTRLRGGVTGATGKVGSGTSPRGFGPLCPGLLGDRGSDRPLWASVAADVRRWPSEHSQPGSEHRAFSFNPRLPPGWAGGTPGLGTQGAPGS